MRDSPELRWKICLDGIAEAIDLERHATQFYYGRTVAGREVDIALEDSAGHLVGVEVKASASLQPGDIRGLHALAEAAGKRWVRSVGLYTGAEVIPFAGNLHGVPVSRLWAAL